MWWIIVQVLLSLPWLEQSQVFHESEEAECEGSWETSKRCVSVLWLGNICWWGRSPHTKSGCEFSVKLSRTFFCPRAIFLFPQVVQNDSGQEWIFPSAGQPFGGDISDELCKFLFTESHQGMYIIAHNLRVWTLCFLYFTNLQAWSIGLRRILFAQMASTQRNRSRCYYEWWKDSLLRREGVRH